MHRPVLLADFDEVITDEQEYILTGACCVRGDVAELFDRSSDGLDVGHVIRVGHAVCSQQSRRVAGSTRWTAHECESGGLGSRCSGFADRRGPARKCGWVRHSGSSPTI